jgi:hypothetical protein
MTDEEWTQQGIEEIRRFVKAHDGFSDATEVQISIGALRGALVALQGELVPRDPTPEMIQAMENSMVEGATPLAESSIVYALWQEVYKAMLRAAPKHMSMRPSERSSKT